MYGNSQVVQKNKFFESLVWAGGDVHQKDKDYPAVVIVYGNPNGAVLLDCSSQAEGRVTFLVSFGNRMSFRCFFWKIT